MIFFETTLGFCPGISREEIERKLSEAKKLLGLAGVEHTEIKPVPPATDFSIKPKVNHETFKVLITSPNGDKWTFPVIESKPVDSIHDLMLQRMTKSVERERFNNPYFDVGTLVAWGELQERLNKPPQQQERINLRYEPYADRSQFLMISRPHSQYNPYGEGTIQVRHAELPEAQEEFLHAAEELLRGTVLKVNELDIYLHLATRDAVHTSVVMDSALTIAAIELGEFEYWSQKAQEQMEIDRLSILWTKLEIEDAQASHLIDSRTILGSKLNKRFQYPMVTEELLDNQLQNLRMQVEQKWFLPNGMQNDAAISITELTLLMYGDDAIKWLYHLLECGYEIRGETQGAARDAIEYAKKLLQQAKGNRKQEAKLVRHHQELTQPITPNDLQYQISERLLTQVNTLRQWGLPSMINLEVFRDEGLKQYN